MGRIENPMRHAPLLLLLLGCLTGCGHDEADRTTGGAATGAVTKPNQVNMGAPPWHGNN